MRIPFEPREPIVRLRNFTPKAYDDAIAAARTCYSMDVVEASSITERQRDSIGPLTFNAGHHTVYQHATFEFSLENVSRQFIWSVLHSFPFYNSDQQSQRYVRIHEIRAFTPPLEGPALATYRDAIVRAFETYQELGEILKEDTVRIMGEIRHLDRHPHERLRKGVMREADKKAIEIARYVLPIATYASLVYTCSGLVLHRLWRLMNTGDVPFEAAQVISKMIQAAKGVDPDFFRKIGEEPMERESLLEASLLRDLPDADPAFDRDFSNHRFAKLLDCTRDAKRVLATSIRYALGGRTGSLTDDDLVDLALNPKRNPYRVETVNLAAHSPVMRSLQNVHYTFVKRLSHSADSQNQRHRMVPGSRPFLQFTDTAAPDYYTPMLIERNARAREIYDRFMGEVWEAKNRLVDAGVPIEFAQYVLPNAANVRFVESGSLMHLMHKWTLRTCLNAQEEIFNASMEEIGQVVAAHPFLASYIGPPCVIRNGVVSPKCTEGDRFCGIPVWQSFPNVSRRL